LFPPQEGVLSWIVLHFIQDPLPPPGALPPTFGPAASLGGGTNRGLHHRAT